MTHHRPSICFVALFAFPLLARDRRYQVIGGAELQQVSIARALAKRGYAVSMICHDFGQPEQIEIDGINVFRACRLDEGIPVLRFFWPRLTSIWRCMAEANSDIYYQRAASMLTGVVAEFCRRNGRKSIFAVAGNPDLDRNTPRIRFKRDRWLFEYGLRRTDRIIVQNEEQARLCQQNFGRSATWIPSFYAPPDDRGNSRRGVVLWVSTIRRVKRPELFLDLARACPTHQFRMVGGAGIGEEKFFESIRSRAGTIPNLEFMGFIPYPEVERDFDDASVVVNTSDSEGFPNTFLQAWARGVPTVSFVDSGARMNGVAVGCQVGSIEEMTACISRLLLDEAERSRLGATCRQYYESSHASDLVLELYEKVIAELIN
jgi:glycosyltransferase involved in cell wall biosynthesis